MLLKLGKFVLFAALETAAAIGAIALLMAVFFTGSSTPLMLIGAGVLCIVVIALLVYAIIKTASIIFRRAANV